MQDYKKQFTQFLLESNALKFGEFTTKSGRLSPYFINAGSFNTGVQLLALGTFYADAIAHEFGSDIDVLFGPAYKGIPIAVAAAMQLQQKHGIDVKYCSLRKEAKDHGDKGSFLGVVPQKGNKIVLVEDVTTAGTSVRETMDALKDYGVEVKGLIVAVDRQEKGAGELSAAQEINQMYGIKTAAIVNLDEILEVTGSQLTAEQKTKIADYRKQYGAKS